MPHVATPPPAIPIHDQATRHAGKRGDNQDGKGNGLGIGKPGDPMNTLTRGDHHAVYSPPMAVRRLTPVECERLQGFPDNWSRIPWKGKPAEDCPDGPRYKACGNSMAVPVMAWIGRNIVNHEAKQAR
jgi:DNA (cytosine-5)-methyltransferase 1